MAPIPRLVGYSESRLQLKHKSSPLVCDSVPKEQNARVIGTKALDALNYQYSKAPDRTLKAYLAGTQAPKRGSITEGSSYLGVHSHLVRVRAKKPFSRVAVAVAIVAQMSGVLNMTALPRH